MRGAIKKFLKDESEATAIEYGLIAALLALGVIAAGRTLGTQLGATFNSTSNLMANASA
jgi:pilus assembly protein Flp/PilA